MKNKIFSALALMAFGVTLTGCGDNWVNNIEPKGEGRLNTASIAYDVINAENVISDNKGALRAPASTDLSNFLVTVTNAAGDVVADWTYSAMPELPTFPVGAYTVMVRSHRVNPAEFEAPYFLGQQTFSIVNGEITDVPKISCVLANIKVTVAFSKALAQYCADDVKVIVTSTEGNSLVFGLDEPRAGYFEAVSGLNTLEVKFSGTVKGNFETFTAPLQGVAAGQHRKITFDIKDNNPAVPDEWGQISAGSGVNVSTTVVAEDLTQNTTVTEPNMGQGGRPGSDEKRPDQPDQPDKPEITFQSDNLDLENPNDTAEFGPGLKDAVVNISAPAGVASLMVQIISDFLTPEELAGVNLSDTFDLAAPGDLGPALAGFGFPVGDQVKNNTTVVFDITNFMPLLLPATNNDGYTYDTVHTFLMTVTDNNGQTATLNLQVLSKGELAHK